MGFEKLKAFIKPASAESSSLSVFVYGLPGSGKTHFAGSAGAGGKRVLILKAEEGCMTVRDVPNVDTISLSAARDIREACDQVLAYLDSEEGRHDYDVVALDTVSAAQQLLINQIRARKGDVGLKDWGVIIPWTQELLRRISVLRQDSIVLCHSVEIEVDDGIVVRPSLSGKALPHQATREFDVAAYATRRAGNEGSVEYVMLTQYPGERYVVKDRTGALAQVIPNDYAVIDEAVRAGGREAANVD